MLVVVAILAIAGLASAQVGDKGSNAKTPDAKQPELRATAVLEWTGEAGKPSASRLIPVTVFTGNRYQDAAVYMARPEPLAVEGDTEYELQQAGVAKGRFDIFSAGNQQGSWYGYGVWKPMIEVKTPKLSVSKVMPEVVRDVDSDRPHLNRGKNDPPNPETSHAPVPPTAGKDSPAARAGSEPHISSTSDDPDRPKLRKRPNGESDTPAAGNTEAVSAIENTDPDRPKLHRGIPAAVREAGKLTGTPPSLQQMVAVSTTTNDEPHSYVYQWADPGDATKMQTALERLARDALAEQHAPQTIGAAHAEAVHPTRSAANPARKSATIVPTPNGITVDDFRAFELSYSGGATLVFSGRTAGEGNAVKYVTLIAQPDFYGSPRVIFKQVTDAGHLDVTPRMKLIDAVDTNGDRRAEFIFELRGRGERQFGIYRIASGRAEQVFLSSEFP